MSLLDQVRGWFTTPVQESMGGKALVELREELERQIANQDLLKEAINELELGQEDIGWLRLSAEYDREFSRDGLARIIKLSRIYYLKSPFVNRAVNVQANYVWGQGVNVQANDPAVNDLVQAFLDDPDNQVELTGHEARSLKEAHLQVTGNLFFCFFVSSADGAVKMSSIPVEEIQDIRCNPENRKQPWYYKRVWSEETLEGGSKYRTAYYPDWRLPKDAPQPPGEVMPYPVYHVKVGALDDMRFGVPEVYQALDWARAYKEFLEDRATLARALSRFAFRMTTQGGARGVAAAKAKLGTTFAQGGTTTETNPPPVTGSTFISGQGVSLDPVRLGGVTIHPDEGRRFLLAVCAAVGLPETYFGDVSVGSLATAKSLDRPTELKMSERRALWANVYQRILQFAIEQAVKAPAGKLSEGVDRHVDVQFPDLLEHDTTARVKAIVSAATLDGKPTVGTLDDRTLVRLLLSALGVDQIDELLDQISPEGGEGLMDQRRAEKAEQAQAIADRQAAKALPPGQQPPVEGEPTEEAFVEALRELRAAVAVMAEGDLQGAQDPFIYLVHHVHHEPGKGKNAVKEELHHCPLFAQADGGGEEYAVDDLRDGENLYHVVTGAANPPKNLYDHLGNAYVIKTQSIGGKDQWVIKGLKKGQEVKWSDAEA